MFGRLARHYDELYATKDYRGEVRRLENLARRFGRAARATWLDVACGTGRHLEYLRRNHDVVGVDASSEMLRWARRRLRGVRLIRGDMRTFRVGQRFDVVTCLFSAIGHLQTERDVEEAFSNFARHTNPGGVVIVEPWIDPADFRVGHLHLVTHRRPDAILVRLASSSRRENHSVIQYHYLLGETGKGIRHLTETDVGLLVSRRRLLGIMRRVGLEPHLYSPGLSTGRSLILGRKPRTAAATP